MQATEIVALGAEKHPDLFRLGEVERDGLLLLAACHNAVDWEIWRSRAKNYWEAFGARVELGLSEGETLGDWVTGIERRMSLTFRPNDRPTIERIVRSDHAPAVRAGFERPQRLMSLLTIAVGAKRDARKEAGETETDDDQLEMF